MKGKLRVALIGPVPPPAGGIASWTLRMLHSDLASQWVDFVHIDESVTAGRQIYGTKTKKSLSQELGRCRRIWRDLVAALKGGNIDVVHANIPAAPLSMLRETVCAAIANKYGVPFIIHFRCTVPNYATNWMTCWLLKELLSKAQAAIVLNSASKECLEGISNIPSHLIPNFVSTNEFAAAQKEARRYEGPLKTVLYTGGIIESKGAFDIPGIARELPKVEFRLAGNGEFPDDVVVPENVVLLGQLNRTAILEEYKNADAFLFLTRFKGEGFSNSLVEAMGFGLPCIASDWAANADMIGSDGGIIVDYHDLHGVVRALESLEDPALRYKMGAINQEKAMRCYSETAVIAQYIELYRKVAS